MEQIMTVKQLLVLTVTCLTTPFLANSQFDSDYLHRTELTKIILNYHAHGFKHFNVDVSQSLEPHKSTFTLYKYRSQNDSVIREKYSKNTTEYLIQDTTVIELNAEVLDDLPFMVNWNKTEVDSSGTHVTIAHNIVEGDTLMGFTIRTYFDSATNSSIQITNSIPQNDYSLYKSVSKVISDDITLHKNYQRRKGIWTINSEHITIKLYSQTEFTKTTLERSYQITHPPPDLIPQNELNIKEHGEIEIENKQLQYLSQTDLYEKKIVTHYDYRGLIEKIVVTTDRGEKYQDRRTKIVLRPAELN